MCVCVCFVRWSGAVLVDCFDLGSTNAFDRSIDTSPVYLSIILTDCRFVLQSSYEKFYDPIPLLNWMKGQPGIPVAACVLYAVSIYYGQAFFAKRDRWNWRYTLAFWNLFLSTFSLVGMLRTAPHLIHNLTHLSFRDNMCLDPRTTYGSGSTGLWVQLFILSKFP